MLMIFTKAIGRRWYSLVSEAKCGIYQSQKMLDLAVTEDLSLDFSTKLPSMKMILWLLMSLLSSMGLLNTLGLRLERMPL